MVHTRGTYVLYFEHLLLTGEVVALITQHKSHSDPGSIAAATTTAIANATASPPPPLPPPPPPTPPGRPQGTGYTAVPAVVRIPLKTATAAVGLGKEVVERVGAPAVPEATEEAAAVATAEASTGGAASPSRGPTRRRGRRGRRRRGRARRGGPRPCAHDHRRWGAPRDGRVVGGRRRQARLVGRGRWPLRPLWYPWRFASAR